MTAPKAYSYVRWSSSAQTRGDSLRRQLAMSRQFADERGLDLEETFRDMGVSARKGKNRLEGALSEFVAGIAKRDIAEGSYLLVESLDRLSREEVIIALEFFLSIIRRGVIIVTLVDRQVFDRDSLRQNPGLLYLSIGVMQRAFEESDLKSRRISEARETARRRAREDNTPYTAGQRHAWLRLVETGGKLVYKTEPKFSPVFNRIFHEADNGLGAVRIARRLNETMKTNPEAVPTLSGKGRWSKRRVQNILKDQALIGYFQPYKFVDGERVPDGKPIKGHFPVIIDPVLFWRVQEKRRQRTSQAGNKGSTESHLFSKLVFCAVCRGRIYFRKEDKRNGPRYFCPATQDGTCTNHAHFPYLKFEEAMLGGVYETNIARILPEQPVGDVAPRIAELHAQIAHTKAYRKRVLDDLKKDPDDDELHERSRQCRAEIRALENDLAEIQEQAQLSKRLHARGYIDEWLESSASIASGDASERELARAKVAASFKTIIERITLHPNRTLTVRMKQNREGYCAEYDFLPNGTRESMRAVGPDGFTITITRQAIEALEKPLGTDPIPNAFTLSFEDYHRARYGSFEERSKQVKVIRLRNRTWKVVPAKAA